MDQEMWNTIVGTTVAVLGIFGVLGAVLVFLYRKGLLPNLAKDLGIDTLAADAKAARQAAEKALHQVSTNGHSSATPTLKDHVVDLQETVESLHEMKEQASRERGQLRGEIRGLTSRFDDHLRYHGVASRVPRAGDFPDDN